MKATIASNAVWIKPVRLPVSSGVPLAALNEMTPAIESTARKKRITGVELTFVRVVFFVEVFKP
jgi:hypothetical protein